MSISRSVTVQAPAQRVWELVSDLPGMGELSPENTGGSWADGATGPTVGARFRGSNRSGWRRWSTTVVVTRCVPSTEFVFEVSTAGLKVAEWGYTVVPEGEGCSVTETWTDQRGRLMNVLGKLATGVADRTAFTETSIDQTLAAVKAAAER